MRYYETLYIVNPNYEQERFDGVLKTVGGFMENEKVNVINHHAWGKKRLAYPIQKHKYGTYVLFQFESERVDFLPEFEQYLRLNKAVIRHQTVRLEERPEIHIEEEPIVDESTEAESTEEVAADTESAEEVIAEEPVADPTTEEEPTEQTEEKE
ncbi:MAG: 30S ribosomal protein S6 [Candidatus Marinimicrobia bacterium]|nr:30S ribosomal protein S6 [Candidatus Neomarinimicrobiota bacterium]MBL7060088.1 30S ribosomal protein S6 [Candidatus Neomarinimicrobiota bacterium]